MITGLRHWQARRRHPQRFAVLEELRANAALDRVQLQAQQLHALDGIVQFARRHTDFHAARLAALPDPLRGPLPSLDGVPVLEKADVLENREAMLARGIDRSTVKLGHTGGSTGMPMAFYYDDAKHERMLAGMMRGFMMSGWRPGQRVLYLWGAARDVSARGVFARPATGLLDSELSLAAVEYSEARLASWAGVIRRWRPVLLYGYASALAELARFVIDSGAQLPQTLIGVYSTAEVLYDWQRALIGQAFACRVFNQYGCREVPNIAWECRHGGLHVFSDMVYLESLPAADGDRLVVTSLSDRVMPFIRYDTGDSGRLLDGECACGSPFPLMQMDMCRHNDLVQTRDGRRLHPALFNRLLYGLTSIRRYQWVQRGIDELELNLVAATPLPAATLQGIEDAIHQQVDGAMRLNVRYVDEIVRNGAGKHRFVIGLAAASPGVPAAAD